MKTTETTPARTEESVSHETAIAIEWLKKTESLLERNCSHLVGSLTNSFDAIVSEWEETGKLRANHRKLDINKAKEAAVSRLKSGRFPLTLDHFTGKEKQTLPPHKGSVRRELKKCPDFWFALGSRQVHPKTAEKLERLGLMERRFTIYGLEVSRTYDWRLTDRGIMERDRTDA